MVYYVLFAVVELKCAVQCYAWGKIGLNSAVAQLAQHNPSFTLEEDKPYSEVLLVTAIGLIFDSEFPLPSNPNYS